MDDASIPGVSAAKIAGAIGEPARARILYCLMDGRARTSTELAVVAGVSPSTASVHLNLLQAARLIKVVRQGKHRYHSLRGTEVAAVLEGLSVLAGSAVEPFEPSIPPRLRVARTCYDHIAGAVGVSLHDRFLSLGWLTAASCADDANYVPSRAGATAFEACGIDVTGLQALRRRFAFGCLDWSERRHHLGGALGAGFLELALSRKWVIRDLDSRALSVSRAGQREFLDRFGAGA
jgi:DNA-binding transcriptional ArsR family regulator